MYKKNATHSADDLLVCAVAKSKKTDAADNKIQVLEMINHLYRMSPY